ncbi:TPA: MptD family putative ECF transporter S component [Streptococcus agalactiae]|uniref:MptD family putative ECF transporter S component n=1 Tax=Bacillota TaxID=1239 RepID=UPI0002BA2292|nr:MULTISPECIES: MptD family putative ECF transporter S component [Bacillota]BET22022.1 MptD family putative ECF transporter S component [Solobacterium moorei]HEO5547838.1 MptD family putative ECF transporter S component [Streptococcus agalactiae]HEP5573558.1 MptD family putative ECF transporter S component [Streptococcus pyogenes]EPU82414.1 membrane protein [Streptococcus agalactiae GB00206]HEO5669004.1 MptD family putative ECF transporter S component [Streptococcus agalactiae]
MMKEKMTVKDIVTVAVMMALFYAIAFVIGMGTVAVPILYLYGTAGIEMFLGSIFYLVAANRVNKHGLLFVWVMIYALITAAMGYMFMVPYFIAVAVISELVMIGKNTYRNPIRNMIGWSTYGIGMMLGIGVPCWIAWESYQKQAIASGFTNTTMKLQYDMVSSPKLMLVGVIVTVILSALGILLSQKILKKHFEKAGILS